MKPLKYEENMLYCIQHICV